MTEHNTIMIECDCGAIHEIQLADAKSHQPMRIRASLFGTEEVRP